MPTVFLSYGRDDAKRARPIAAAIEKAGYSVWWDQHIRGGSQFAQEIEQALNAAGAVVVLWSERAVASPWVRDEAAAGRDSGRLVPVRLDATEPPLGFRQYQSIDFSRWRGRGTAPEMSTLLADIDALIAKPHAGRAMPTPLIRPAILSRFGIRNLVLLGLVGLLIVGGTYWLLRPQNSSPPTVAVTAADHSPLSQTLVRDVTVRLAALKGNATASFQLLDEQANQRPDLKIAINAAQRDGEIGANVSLLSPATQTVLWSKQLRQAAGPNADLEGAIALAAGQVLNCAVEESSAQHGRLNDNDRKAWLNACVSVDELGVASRPVSAILREITGHSPKFSPAWARLLISEAEEIRQLSIWADPADQLRSGLQQDIAQARRADPDMAEIAVANLSLAPTASFARSIAMIERVKAQHPDSPAVLTLHADAMAAVGRVGAAADDARMAAELDPLSPALRASWILALVGVGKVDEARQELARAETLWPGSEAVASARTLVELRYGNFERALPQTGARMDAGIQAYIEARRHPTDANKNNFIDLARSRQLNMAQKRFVLQALPELDRVDDLYALVDQWPVDAAVLRGTDLLFRPWVARFRRDARFMRFARRLGLVDYWQTSGIWPDFCSEPDRRYDCRSEAAKNK